MKTGDIVYCKKSYTNFYNGGIAPSIIDTFTEGKEYVIEIVSEINVVNPYSTLIYLHGDLTAPSKNYHYAVPNITTFVLKSDIPGARLFEEYFLSLKEIRKIKLKKINENR